MVNSKDDAKMNDIKIRNEFEAWISATPFEKDVSRFGENSAWPGGYRKLDVELAWQAWLAAIEMAADLTKIALHNVYEAIRNS